MFLIEEWERFASERKRGFPRCSHTSGSQKWSGPIFKTRKRQIYSIGQIKPRTDQYCCYCCFWWMVLFFIHKTSQTSFSYRLLVYFILHSRHSWKEESKNVEEKTYIVSRSERKVDNQIKNITKSRQRVTGWNHVSKKIDNSIRRLCNNIRKRRNRKIDRLSNPIIIKML